MKILAKIFLALSLVVFYTIEAQQVVERDTLSGTELTITMDSRVSEALASIEGRCAKKSSPNFSTVSSLSNDNDNEARVTKPKKIYVANRELTNAEICRKNPKILGYKIQITTVKSNDEANEVKSYFRKRFPNLKVEVDASFRPNYKILAGSYFSKKSAAADLASIKEYFKSALAIQYRVFCVEAK